MAKDREMTYHITMMNIALLGAITALVFAFPQTLSSFKPATAAFTAATANVISVCPNRSACAPGTLCCICPAGGYGCKWPLSQTCSC